MGWARPKTWCTSSPHPSTGTSHTHLAGDDAGSAGSAPQHKGELAHLRQPCCHHPLDVLAGRRQEQGQDQCRQGELRRQ